MTCSVSQLTDESMVLQYFGLFSPLEALSGARDPSQMKDLAETHLFLIPIDHDL